MLTRETPGRLSQLGALDLSRTCLSGEVARLHTVLLRLRVVEVTPYAAGRK